MNGKFFSGFGFSNPFFTPVYFILFALFIAGCESETNLWLKKSSELVLSDYIEQHSDEYSEFGKIIKQEGTASLLSVRGPYTLFLPTDDAMKAYYREKGVDENDGFPCVTDADTAFLRSLVYNHLVVSSIATSDIGLGALPVTNALGDYIVSEFQGSEIILNKKSRITKRDIPVANGLIHRIDHVIEPLTKSVYDVIASNPGLSIFTEGLRLTGIRDTLSIIEFPYGNATARCRYTILAVPDTLYKRMGINNVNDLIALYAEPGATSPDDIMKLNNGFYRYIEYHCMNGTYYLSDFTTKFYPILSVDNFISVTIENDYKLNLEPKTKIYTGFYIEQSNVPSKNGAIHIVNDLLPVNSPERMPIIMETTDFLDMKQGDYFGSFYMKWSDGENTFAKIKWVGDYLEYYYKAIQSENINYDCLSMLGWWEISVTFPKIPKGKYTVWIYQPGWNDVTDCVVYVDGEKTKYIYTGPMGTGSGGLQQVADVEFLTTAEHTITLRNVSSGGLFWDYVKFIPVK